MQVFELLFALILNELQHPPVVLFVLGLSESIQLEREGLVLFGLLNYKGQIIEFNFLLFPRIQNRFLDINFALLFESLALRFPLLDWVLHWKWSLEKLNTLFIVLDLLFFFKIFKVLGELFGGTDVLIGLGLFDLFIIFANGLLHILELRKLLRLLALVCWELNEAVELLKRGVLHFFLKSGIGLVIWTL